MPEYSGELTHVEHAWIHLWLIALLPFLGAVINAVAGRRLQASEWQQGWKKRFHIGSPAVTAVALGAMLGAFVLGVVGFVQLMGLPAEHRYLYTFGWQMVRIGSLDVNFAFAMDPLSSLMTLVITGVGSLIHLYAASYMEKEPSYWRFFCYLNLFVFSMLLLVLGDNFIVMFFGWEGVGLCSYLLIGFWYKDYQKATAGMKAFVVNRIGDWGFVCGMALLFWGLGGAWLDQAGGAQKGEYVPDFRARFVAVEQQPLKLHGAGDGAKGQHDGAKGSPRAKEHGEHGPTGLKLPAEERAEPYAVAQNDPHDHGEGRGDPSGRRGGVRSSPRRGGIGGDGRMPPLHGRKASSSVPELSARSGATGLLTMTSHPGAQVFFGISSKEQLLSARLGRCEDKPSWHAGDGAQLRADCFAVAPFVRKRISAGTPMIVVAPGGGAVVTGDGDEYGAMRVKIRPGKETVIMAVGPTLVFRELHDQLQIKGASGTPFLENALKKKTVWGGIGLITLACLCFFVGATGKSAQLPLYVWLPDAMAGPTPVSALIHAATMVTAGVYMIARMNFLFSLSPTASGVVALTGALTALFAATIGFFQYDIKKVLAYSTVSQLGFMFIAVGVGAYWAGVFHLMTHAFFKACLFLGSGSVIHGMHHVLHDEVEVQDMRNMGGLRAVMPKTALTYKIACMAITAAPPFLAGFWSKDELLWKAWNTQATGFVPGWLVYSLGLTAALGTSFYMWRSYYLTFEGKHAIKAIKTKVHESPAPITLVLVILAFLAAFSGLVLGLSQHVLPLGFLPHEPLFEQWLAPVMAHSEANIAAGNHTTMYALMALSIAGAAGAWSVAWFKYGAERDKGWAAWEKTLPGFELLHNKYYVDELYQKSFVAGFMKLRLLFAEMDRWIVDGLVNGAAVVARGVSWASGAVDKHVVDGAVNLVANGTLEAGDKLRQAQTGRVQSYVYGILGGVAFFAILSYLLG